MWWYVSLLPMRGRMHHAVYVCDHAGLAGGPFVMLLGRDYAMAASVCLRISLLILPVLHSTMWCTRFLRDFAKLSSSKYRGVVMMRGVLAAVCVCQVSSLVCVVSYCWLVACGCAHTSPHSHVFFFLMLCPGCLLAVS